MDTANGSGGAASGRSMSNAAFARTSFLDGGNAAYVEQLQECYLRDPASLDPSWRDFFAEINDDGAAVATIGAGAALETARDWPVRAPATNSISALDGNWADVETRIGAKLKAEAEGRRLFPRTICFARPAIRSTR